LSRQRRSQTHLLPFIQNLLHQERISDNQGAGCFAAANFALLLIILLPLPTVDGGVIWREIGRLRRR
jgi:Zn-dependent protease